MANEDGQVVVLSWVWGKANERYRMGWLMDEISLSLLCHSMQI
jgi:hypothetical protein